MLYHYRHGTWSQPGPSCCPCLAEPTGWRGAGEGAPAGVEVVEGAETHFEALLVPSGAQVPLFSFLWVGKGAGRNAPGYR